MKIGIISINLYTKWLNLACPLHSYAMQQFLVRNGYDCKVIDYKASYYDNYNMRHPSDYYKEKYKFRLSRFPADEKKRADWFRVIALTCELEKNYRALYNERASRYDKFKNFIDTRLNVTEKGFTSASMEFEDPGLDCYMCVTDVIWKNQPNLERAFFLANKCMDNKIKIAYSASRGSDYTKPGPQRKQFFDYLEDFDAISVREPSLKEHIDECSDIESTVVLDPVMLHDKSFYGEIAKEPEEKGYMFLYHVVQAAEDTIEQAVKYAKAHNLTIIESSDRPYPEGKLTKYEGIEHKWIYDIGIEEWLGYIKNAECVFTNSFHCCCLSIIFGKNFFAGSRNGDKVDNVLSIFGLENRRFDINTDILGNEPGDIDYERVHAVLAEKRAESGNWLLGALKKAEKNPRQPKDYDAARMNSTYHVICNFNVPDSKLTVRQRAEGSPEIRTEIAGINNGETVLVTPKAQLIGYRFIGWALRTKIDNEYYRFTKDGGFAPWETVDEKDYRIFAPGSKIPHIPANGVLNVIADAVWEKLVPTFAISFNSTLKADAISCDFSESEGELSVTKSNCYEYKLNGYFANGADYTVPECLYTPDDSDKKFAGWKLRFWLDMQWCWYLDDGSYAPVADITEEESRKIKIFLPGEKLPKLPEGAISNAIFCANWNSFEFTLAYHSGSLKAEDSACDFDKGLGSIKVTDKGAYEYLLNEKISNGCTHCFAENGFTVAPEVAEFTGWYLRVKDKSVWKWYLEDGSLADINTYSAKTDGKRRVFAPGEAIENLRLPPKAELVAVATWKYPDRYSLAYHSGTLKAEDSACSFDKDLGAVKVTDKGAYEYLLNEKIANDGTYCFAPNGFDVAPEVAEFTGWYLRVKDKNVWKWYLEDGSLVAMSEYSAEINGQRKVFAPDEAFENLQLPSKAELVAVATWKFPKVNTVSLAYHSGTLKAEDSACDFDEDLGTVKVTDKGAYEYLLNQKISGEGAISFAENSFIPKDESIQFGGWYLRVKADGGWNWYLEDGTLADMNSYSAEADGQRRVFLAGEEAEGLNIPEKASLVAVATWKKNN